MKSYILLGLIILVGCTIEQSPELVDDTIDMVGKSMPEDLLVATFAGGCFWCTEADFEKVPGVVAAVSGYTGGFTENPTYREASSGKTGHTEAVQVSYDPDVVTYLGLLEDFWRKHDPTDNKGQFVDRGTQYRPGIFYVTEEEKAWAEKSKSDLDASGVFDKPIVTEITRLDKFYPAEDYHQDYAKNNPIRYNVYRSGSGRDKFLVKHWGEIKELNHFVKPSAKELRKQLSEEQFRITQEDGTERAYDNEFWDHKEEGIYVDVVSGEPLFSSTDKYDSKTGWPSFTKPLENDNIVKKKDYKLILPRTEIRSKNADSHLGHLFSDGPAPTGLRYCMNSAALRFIPKNQLEDFGYGKYLALFE